MRSSILFFCLHFLMMAGLTGQAQKIEFAAFLLPDSLKNGAESVVREYDKVYTVLSDNSATVEIHKVVTLLKSSSDENELVLHYDGDSKISRFNATIYDETGNQVRTIKKSELTDVMAVSGGQFYTDSRVQYVELEHSSYPYTIVYDYQLKVSNFGIVNFPHYFPQAFDQGVVKSSFTANVPLNNELSYDLFGLPEPASSLTDEQRSYRWEVNGLVPVQYESYTPVYSQMLPNVRTKLRRFDILKGVSASFDSWDDFGKMMHVLMEGRNQLPAELAAEARKAVAGLTSDREKIKVLYKLMQARVRYVGVQLGVGGWQPFSAEYVEQNRYGDCKALSNYMMSLLEIAEIESYPTLIYAGRPGYEVREDFPVSAFNHMILYVPAEDMYLECTSNYLPAGYLNDWTLDRSVLWITPEGGELARTPARLPSEHGHLRTQRLDLKEDGSAQLTLDARYVGEQHEYLRYRAKELSERELKEYLHEQEELPDVTGTDFTLTVHPDEPLADLHYRTELPRYGRKMGKRFFVPINRLFAYNRTPEKLESRTFPVVSRSARFYVDSVYISLPEGLRLESGAKESVDIEHPAGEYHAEFSQSGTQLLWTRTLKLRPVTLPPEAYEEFRDFYLAVSKAEKGQLVFKSVTK